MPRCGVCRAERLAGIEASEKASKKILLLAKQAGKFGMELLYNFIKAGYIDKWKAAAA